MVKRWLLILLIAGLSSGQAAGAVSPDVATVAQEKKLVVGVIDGPPWSMKDDDGIWIGISVDLWREVAEQLHVGYEYKEYDLEGLLNAVERGEVDLSASGLAITAEREKRFDFTDPYVVFNQTIAVNANERPGLLQIIRSELQNRGLIGLSVVFVIITIFGGAVLWALEQQGGSEEYRGRHVKAFLKSLFWSITVLIGRDLPKSLGWTTHAPATRRARMFGIVWMVLGIVLFSLFTASAASILTSRQLQSIVSTPEDLHHVKVGTVKDSASETYLVHKNIKHVAYENTSAMLHGLLNHEVDAVCAGATTLSYYAGTQAFNNKISILRFSLRQDFAAIPVPADSPLRKQISEAILPILESKKWQEIRNKYVPPD